MENILLDSLYNYENIRLGVKIRNPKRKEQLEIFEDLKHLYTGEKADSKVIYYLFQRLVVTTEDSPVNFKDMSVDELGMLIENPRITEDFSDMIYSVTNIYARIMKVGMKESIMNLEAEELKLLDLHLKLITTNYVETAQDIERTQFNIDKERKKIERLNKLNKR